MVNKKYVLLFVIINLSILVSCSSKKDESKNLLPTVMQLKKATKKILLSAPYIDSSNESIYAYNNADSLLNSVELNEADTLVLYRDIAKIYKACSYIFYGMSYSKARCYSGILKKGTAHKLPELKSLLNSDMQKNNYDFLENGLLLNYSLIYFYSYNNYLVSSKLYDTYKTDSLQIIKNNKKFSKIKSFRVNSLQLLKLTFDLLANFLFQLEYISNFPKVGLTAASGLLLQTRMSQMGISEKNKQKILNLSSKKFNREFAERLFNISDLMELLSDKLKKLLEESNTPK